MTKGTVLVVDDDPSIVDLLTDALELDGYQVQTTIGNLILPLARAVQPAVVLLDVMMPGKDGVAVGQCLRADPRTAAIPVIALSGGEQLYVRAAEMGADACLAKPFDLDDVRQCVERWAIHPDGEATPTAPAHAGVKAEQERDRRPAPCDVRGWFREPSDADALVAAVATLRADPNWGVDYVPGPAASTLTLTYWPTGEGLRIALERAGALWRPAFD